MSTVRKGARRDGGRAAKARESEFLPEPEVVSYSARRSGSSWLWFGGGLVAAVLLVVLGYWAARLFQPAVNAGGADTSSASTAGPRVGQRAPDFQLPSVSGENISLAQYRGRPVLLNFWATWCPPCKAEMPDIEKAFLKHQAEGLVILGVDEEEDPADVQKFLKERSFSWNFLLDEQGRLGETYRVTALPTSYFIDRSGMVRSVHVGAISAALLETRLAEVLAQ